ncbi:MAG: M1 family aminopeptidase [Planctomycetaceae bacterium]
MTISVAPADEAINRPEGSNSVRILQPGPLEPAPIPPAVDDVSDQSDSRLQQLPEYSLDIDLHPDQRRVSVQQIVRWTNAGGAATQELVFQVTANSRLSKEMISVGERTVESLRLDPRTCIDYQGGRFHLESVSHQDQSLSWEFDASQDTHLHIHLPQPVAPGESVEIRMEFWIDIPPIMGRLGQYKGITNLLNWYPVLAVYRKGQWQPVPWIPWHQPWFNEAGNYNVRLSLPASHEVATGGHITDRQTDDRGIQHLQIQGNGLRDFTIVASPLLKVQTANSDGIPIRVLTLQQHAEHGRVLLNTAVESVRLYCEWFGEFPYRELEITESYFGWNGNESSGVVMIDNRILDLPKFAERYLEHLASHEICHQWWYSAVGTDGYHESWMDEGLVTWFTRVKMEDKYGHDADVLNLPGYGPFQFPNVQYMNLVHSGYTAYRGRGGDGAALGSLEDMGHLHNLMARVYDRGARITGIIQHRMGREQFFSFMKQLYAKYRFDILTVADFHHELEVFTGEDWDPFFKAWLESSAETDWNLESVSVTKTDSGYRTQAHIVQQGTISEAADVRFSFPEQQQPIRLATLSETQQPEGIQVQQTAPGDWLVTVVSDTKPSQVVVDPESILVDSQPDNNAWKPEVSVRVSPIYTPADESGLLQPWQQHSVVAGFGVDPDGRLGLRASLIDADDYRISPFIAYTAATATRNDDHLSAGVDGIIYNVPNANWQLMGRYEYALLSTLANDPGHQARFALRRVINYTTSLMYPHLSYVDLYTRIGDNFFPDQDDAQNPDPAIQRYGDVRAIGIDVHADSQMPYWNPDRGVRFDGNVEHGFQVLGSDADYSRLSGQVGVVQRLSNAPAWLSETKLAGRVSGGYGWDDNGEHFRFGGPGRFRGRAAADVKGNAFWLTSLEWRFPLTGELDYKVLDNTAALHSVDGAIFYDLGRSYLQNEAQGKADHAIGLGLYFRIPLLSFVENVTIRTEYGYSLTNSTGALWMGLYRAF